MKSVPELVRSAVKVLPEIEHPSFGAQFDSFANARVVLIGDGSHGTSEFYRARAAITKRLIEHHGFDTIAIEADWPDAKSLDRYVRLSPSTKSKELQPIFKRFPTWMWRNQEVHEFLEWLRGRNAKLPVERRAGIYGLDLYSMGESIRAVVDYLEHVDPETANVARRRYGCLAPWVEDPAKYGRVALSKGFAPCEQSVLKMLRDLLKRRLEYAQTDGEDFLDAEMNARLVTDAEEYYRSMYYGSDESWNLRDTHMFETLARLLHHRKGSKAVVWAHTSHVGDARHTGMGMSRGELNIGQLCREQFGPDRVQIIGCGTHTGTVAASHEWDEPMQVMRVRPSMDGSYERIMHDANVPRCLLDLRRDRLDPKLHQALMQPQLERFIGVIYRPDTERWSHYSKAILPLQLDAYVWFDTTRAVEPFETVQPVEPLSHEETFPFGL
ncbi:hypothetical protein L228DRAFT_249225 [Xylona heveae TC161]|uniref:Erythromycin esterase n=1 Tax=Xylona heveae (strain CBS 132557 / TC161) TaxID=1328760 RepID=A0A165FUY2_XYLHT|nr:hypothetical protein L228DRAFT_249225 [Xylona heveae TC161]KZF21411.1 hypothetical protein L228DRAFT_249225 [Xylona heveae TC161]